MKYELYVLTFGTHSGKLLSDPSIPDEYLWWLASRGKYLSKRYQFECESKIPVDAWMAGRVEMERRGYDHIGERFIKREE